MTQRVKILWGLFGIVCLLQLVYVYAQNRTVDIAAQLDQLQAQIRDQAGWNSELEEEVLTAESLTAINQKATNAGMVPAQYIYVH